MKETNYHQLLEIYDKRCHDYLDLIHSFERHKLDLENDLLNRQQNTLVGFGKLIPKPYRLSDCNL